MRKRVVGNSKGPFKRFQHLLQHAFNTVVEPNVGGRLNRSFNIVERLVETVLGQLKFNSTSVEQFLCS